MRRISIPVNGLHLFLALMMSFALTGCFFQKSSQSDSSVGNGTGTNVSRSCADEDLVNGEGNSPAKAGAQVITWKVSQNMFDTNGSTICTPKAMRIKIKKVFDLYSSIPSFNVTFRYGGAETGDYPNCVGLPQDGVLRVHLSCMTNGNAQGGLYGIWGTANSYTNPTGAASNAYPGGEALFPTNTLDYMELIHEIGHALGQNHIPATGANMTYYIHLFQGLDANAEYYSISEQERADLIARMPTAAASVFTIRGQVISDLASKCSGGWVQTLQGFADVYAVNVTTGHTYAGLATCSSGYFWINILQPGTYRLVATPDGRANNIDQSLYSASWYVNNTTVTNNPTAGTTFTVNGGSPTYSGLVIQMGNAGAAPSNFALNPLHVFPDPTTYASTGNLPPVTFDPMTISPGESGLYRFETRCDASQGASFAGTTYCDPISTVSAYGTAPDYTYSNLNNYSNSTSGSTTIHSYKINIAAAASAEPGFRLMVSQGATGTYQVGVMGVHILNGATKPPVFSFSLSQQISGLMDFTQLNEFYWQ